MTAPTVPLPRAVDAPPELVLLRGEATVAAGLVIVPDVSDGAYTGRWRLWQDCTDEAMTGATSLAYAREVATLLAGAGIDWTLPDRILKADPAAVAAVDRIVAISDAALFARTPLWWGRSSWVSHGPLWRVGTGTGVSTATFEELWWLLDALPADEVHIGYDPRPTWTLRCAAPLCTEGDGEIAELPSPDEWDEGLPLRHADRSVLIVEAVAAGWSRRGTRWLCRECALAHFDSPTITW